MNNKGFAVTGIIYTLCSLFLIILLTTISGLNLLQKLKVNSIQNFEESFKGEELNENEFLYLNILETTPVTGKYVFQVTKNDGAIVDNCVAYLSKNTDIKSNFPVFFPEECNDKISNFKLIEIYTFD